MDEDEYHSYGVSVLWEPLDNLSNTFMYNRTVTETNGDAIVAVEYIKGSLRQELEQSTNEIQPMGKSFDDKLDWRVGAYWLNSEPTGPNANWVAFCRSGRHFRSQYRL